MSLFRHRISRIWRSQIPRQRSPDSPDDLIFVRMAEISKRFPFKVKTVGFNPEQTRPRTAKYVILTYLSWPPNDHHGILRSNRRPRPAKKAKGKKAPVEKELTTVLWRSFGASRDSEGLDEEEADEILDAIQAQSGRSLIYLIDSG